jgi:hypothetical protein
VFADHRDPAFLIDLRVFRFHAGGDLRHVRNDIAAEAYGLRRTRLASFLQDLFLRAGAASLMSEKNQERND